MANQMHLKFYLYDFSSTGLIALDNQSKIYIIDMQSSDEFSILKGIGSLSNKLVEIEKYLVYPLMYSLVKLALTLSVATATMERAFSVVKIVKNQLHN